MELFEETRREYRHGVGTIKGVAKKLKVHRRVVRQALARAVPPERKAAERSRPKLGPVADFIDERLKEDLEAPRKQRHTAHRIWQRLGQEKPGWEVAEATVRRYVQQRKEELGLKQREVFIPQTFEAGGEAFHVAYHHATQQAFLEAHELAFRYFGGVFRSLRSVGTPLQLRLPVRKHGVAACSIFHYAKESLMMAPITPLRQRMTEDMQVRNLALNTQTSYVQQVSLFARHFNKSPELLGPEDIAPTRST